MHWDEVGINEQAGFDLVTIQIGSHPEVLRRVLLCKIRKIRRKTPATEFYF